MLAFRHHPAIAKALELNEALASRHRSKAARRSPPAAAAASGLRGGLGRVGIGGRRSGGELARVAARCSATRASRGGGGYSTCRCAVSVPNVQAVYRMFPLALAANASTVERIVCANVSST